MQSFVVLSFLLLSFLIHGSSETLENPFVSYCINGTFSPNSTYNSNLKALFSDLVSNASQKLYHNSSVGRPPNATAYGDFQCRGDLDAAACRDCVTTATANSLRKICPLHVGAVIWFDDCVFRYSNRSFFSVVTEKPLYVLVSVDDVDAEVDQFDKVVAATLNATARNASSSVNFATKEVDFGNLTVYTLAQCTGDLSNLNCGKCLTRVIGILLKYSSGRNGARILSPSCTIRYEIYPFYGAVTPSFTATSPAVTPSFTAASPAVTADLDPVEPALSAAVPSLLSVGTGKGRATMAMAIGVVVAGYFL